MKLEGTFLKSKVARRVFGLFFLSSLLPMGVLGWISFSQVQAHLQEQSRQRLEETSKNTSMNLVEKLLFVRAELEVLASQLGQSDDLESLLLPESVDERFDFLLLSREGEEPVTLLGADPSFQLSPSEAEQIQEDKPTLLVRPSDRSQVLMALRLRDRGRKDLLLGAISIGYLLNIDPGGAFSNTMEIVVLSHDREALYASMPVVSRLQEALDAEVDGPNSGDFQWASSSDDYQASFRSVPLGFQFGYPYLTVVLSESRSKAMAAVETFRRTFPILVVASILLVALLSTSQIRHSLGPLEKLREGTQRIARAEFQTQVDIRSGDEFEELATSFNKMAVQLGRQFNTLATLGEIDRAVLSALKREDVITTIVKRIPELFGTSKVALTVFPPEEPQRARTFLADGSPQGHAVVDQLGVSEAEQAFLLEHPEGRLLSLEENGLPSFLRPLKDSSTRYFLLQPILIQKSLAGLLCLGFHSGTEISNEQRSHLRQIGDQIAVAFSNAQLLNDLDELNWSALEALARTVDAKSKWTAGHSQRVTHLAIRIAKEIQLSEKEIEVIHRGGLLHDIGKIGVPAQILDKPGKLTDEEFETIKLHPVIGARILEPVKAFSDVIPIVRSHHERIDGRGYPDGLVGEEIRFDVRIVAVADVFDAIYSDRPYRPRRPLDDVIRIIREGSGSHFDPDPVKAFLSLVDRERHSFLEMHRSTSAEDYLPTHSYGA